MTMTDGQQQRCVRVLGGLLPVLFGDEEEARTVLSNIGRQRERQSAWQNPRIFWTNELQRLELGVVTDGVEMLARAAHEEYPGNTALIALVREIDEDGGSAPAPAAPAGPPAGAEAKPDLPAAVLLPPAEQPAVHHSFVLSGSDQYDRFLQLVQTQVDSQAEQCYVTATQSAVLVSDPGARVNEIQERLLAEVSSWEPGSDVSIEYHETSGRPHLLSRIVVHGTDNRSFELRNVPSTTQVSDIARAVLQEGYTDNQRRRVRTTVDRVNSEGGAERLDPGDDLADAGVQDGDELRLATEATAGAEVSTAAWRESVQRAHAQILRFEAKQPDFAILETDNNSLPTWYRVEFAARGFAPPADSEAALAQPRLQSRHQVTILLPADFPIRPPLAIFETEIFHPNVLDKPEGLIPTGAACLGALTDSYRPDLDFGELCRMLVNMAGYQEYEIRPTGADEGQGEGFLNRRAAAWAASPGGQQRILDRGGKPAHQVAVERQVELDVKQLDEDDWGAYEDES